MISEIEHPDELRHGLGPIWAAARVANPDFAVAGAVTFHAGASFTHAAVAWRDSIFAPMLVPALRSALGHARRGELRELSALDKKLSEQLGEIARESSIRAGRRLALRSSGLQGDRLLPRLGEWVRDGATPGHLAIVFAARCAAFSLPDRIAVGAYLFEEMCAGAPTAPIPEVCDFVAACIEPLGGSSLELRAA
jgi:hypothetical protein